MIDAWEHLVKLSRMTKEEQDRVINECLAKIGETKQEGE